jgi:hypothetical protein
MFSKSGQISDSDTLISPSPGENNLTTNPTRVFPDLQQILIDSTNAGTGVCANAPIAGPVPQSVTECFAEFLPTIDYVGFAGTNATPLSLHFRFTARDGKGGVDSADTTLLIDNTAGPLRVTSQSSLVVYAGLSTQNVTWNVNNTNTASLAPNVKISLSTDGGLTYPYVLAATTPNDGSEAVNLPDVTTVLARIKVEAVGNIFFDVNHSNFNIISPSAASASISGSVTTSDGAPLAGVVMNLNGARTAKAITDGNGNYHFNNIETGNFYVVTPSFVNHHFSPSDRAFSLAANKTDATFTAMPDSVIVGNVIDTPEYFVRQQYLDFLGREPDPVGLNFWSDQVLSCGADTACAERRVIDVSAAFFHSLEFQQTGGLVDGLYRASYDRRPLFSEFMPDVATVAGDRSAASKAAFVNEWVQRPAFQTAYGGLTNQAYVDTLIGHTGVGFTANEKSDLLNSLNAGASTRADVLRQIAEDERFVAAKRNAALVMMQYFGYLRRDPDERGYQFWLGKLNEFNGNFEQAEMVKAFIISTEYRNRFRQ